MNYATIDNFKDLTRQEMFNLSAAHVIKNGKASTTAPGGTCVYGGIGCAAAPFLREEMRDKMDEEVSSWDGLVSAELVHYHESDFVVELQDAHDMSVAFTQDDQGRIGPPTDKQFMEAYIHKMRAIARTYDLDPSILSTWVPKE